MTKVIAELLATGMVNEADVQRSQEAGRPRILLRVVPHRLQVLAMSIESDAIHSAVLGLDLQARKTTTHSSAVAGQRPGDTLVEIASIVAQHQRQLQQDARKVLCCAALVLPGMTDTLLRKSMRSRALGWRDEAIAEPLEKQIHLPVVVHNNTRAMAFAEFRHLKLNEDQPLLFVQARFGLGASLVNSAVPSPHGHYGVSELGHLPIGNNAFADRVPADNNLMSVTNEPYLRSVLGLAPGDEHVIPVLENRRDAGDPQAMQLYRQTLDNLARGLGIAVNLLNPSVIVLGGIYAHASPRLVQDLAQEVKMHAQEELTEGLRIQCSQLGRAGALQGAAIIAFDRLLRDRSTYHPTQEQ